MYDTSDCEVSQLAISRTSPLQDATFDSPLFARLSSGRKRKRATPCVWYVCADETGGETWSADEEVLQRQVRLLALNEGAAAVEVPVELFWHKQEVISVKGA